METTADEINEGLALFYGRRYVFTDSLDACSKVADKLGVEDIEFHISTTAENRRWCRILLNRRWQHGHADTRSHAWAAALWAAVKETNE